jgi:sterol desaturase/sphingolipid hydroxylase (fatty acid hydroxylase superfamily)
METFLRHASQAYAFSYFGVMIVIALLECVVPRRAPGDTLSLRWFGNIAITILDTLVVRALFPILGIAWAVLCHERGWGLFNRVAWSPALEFVLTVLGLDLVLYGQHNLLHRVTFLWRIHRTHHSDHDCDLTTGLRFHPLEMVWATLLLMGAILITGAPPAAVFVSQVLSTAITFLEHANVHVPASLDRFVRIVFVTPDMHRIHHSSAPGESRSNFSTTFSWWDRLFGTYTDQPAAGHANVAFGTPGFEDRKHLTLPWMLAQPFLSEPDSAAPEASAAGRPDDPESLIAHP